MPSNSLAQKDLKEALHYDPDTGIFTRLTSPSNNVKIGDIAGCAHKTNGYLVIQVKGVLYYAHRLAWLYVYGEWPKECIDHISHNRADNRISNLREVTRPENNKNLPIRKTNVSGTTGVHWNKIRNKWHSQIMVNGKAIYLGLFSDKSDAISARKDGEIRYGFHENHGT